MPKQMSFAFVASAVLLLSTSVQGSDIVYPGGGTLAQVVDGGGTQTTITLVNLDTVVASYSLYFYSDSGAPLTLSTTAGTGALFNGQLPVNGSTIIQTNGGGSIIQQGYAVLITSQQVGGSLVFGLPLPNTPLAEASCPLDTGLDYIFGIPFDETTASIGLALANSIGDGPYQTDGGATANLAISFFDQSGNMFYSTTMQLAYGQHTAFMLDAQFPQIAGRTGTVVIVATDSKGNPYAIKVLGLRANAAGTTLTSVTPLIPYQ